MQYWSENYKKILTRSEIEVHLLSGYVDDGRQLTSSLPLGMRYSKEEKIFKYSEPAYFEDNNKINEGESNNERMTRICLPAMNDVNKNLEFTVETAAEFENERLPTLDFQVWQEGDGSINHTYFQKPMKTPLVIMARSDMGTQQKVQILANELTKRLSNINETRTDKQEKIKVIEQYTRELKNSEFGIRTAQEIIKSGIRGHRIRIIRRTANGGLFYRPAHKTLG